MILLNILKYMLKIDNDIKYVINFIYIYIDFMGEKKYQIRSLERVGINFFLISFCMIVGLF